MQSSIDSILNQSFRDFEFIIVNDGSLDNTKHILERYATTDQRIVVIHQERQGVTKALNKGLKRARGRYIARQDADDISCVDRLEKQIAFLSDHEEYALVGSNWEFIDEKGAIVSQYSKYFLERYDLIRENIARFNPFCYSSLMFRREVIANIGFYNEKYKYAQDYEYLIRIMKQYKICNLKNVLVYKRSTPFAISEKKLKQQIYCGLKAKISAIRLLSLSKFNYISVLDSVSNLILPTNLSQRMELFKVRLRNFLIKTLMFYTKFPV